MELALSNGFQEMSFDETMVVDGGGIADLYYAVGFSYSISVGPDTGLYNYIALTSCMYAAASQPGQPYLLGLI